MRSSPACSRPRCADGEIITEIEFPIPMRAGYAKFPNPASRYALVGVFVAQFRRCGARGRDGCSTLRLPRARNGKGAEHRVSRRTRLRALRSIPTVSMRTSSLRRNIARISSPSWPSAPSPRRSGDRTRWQLRPSSRYSPPMIEKDEDPLLAAAAWISGHQTVAIATVTRTWGSAPRPAGSQMAVREDGAFVGSVSGGCVEGAVIGEAQAALQDGKARNLKFGVTNEEAWAVGLACGGTIEVNVTPVTKAPGRETIAALNAARDAKRAVVLATELSSGSTPARLSRRRRERRACRCRGEGRAPRREHDGRGRRQIVVPHRVQSAARSRDHRRGAYRPAARAHGRAGRLRRARHRSAHGLRDGGALSGRRAVA